jgi:hypothetical protein
LMIWDVFEWWRWWRDIIVWWRWVGARLMLPFVPRRLLPLLLLAKDIDCIM